VAYTKAQTYQFTKKLYQLLKTQPDTVILKKLWGNCCGLYHPDTDTIDIDFRRGIIPTLVHEALHKFHPNWSETKVWEHESKIMNSLTPRQVKNIIRMLAAYL